MGWRAKGSALQVQGGLFPRFGLDQAENSQRPFTKTGWCLCLCEVDACLQRISFLSGRGQQNQRRGVSLPAATSKRRRRRRGGDLEVDESGGVERKGLKQGRGRGSTCCSVRQSGLGMDRHAGQHRTGQDRTGAGRAGQGTEAGHRGRAQQLTCRMRNGGRAGAPFSVGRAGWRDGLGKRGQVAQRAKGRSSGRLAGYGRRQGWPRAASSSSGCSGLGGGLAGGTGGCIAAAWAWARESGFEGCTAMQAMTRSATRALARRWQR